jgi:hypothetical protein
MGDRAAVGTGTVLRPHKLVDVSGVPVPIPNPEGFVHLPFRRFAGCPICNVYLQSIIRRHDEIVAAGIREVVVFHSSAQELRRHVVDLPSRWSLTRTKCSTRSSVSGRRRGPC